MTLPPLPFADLAEAVRTAPAAEEGGAARIRFHDFATPALRCSLREEFTPRSFKELLGHSTIAITLDTTPVGRH